VQGRLSMLLERRLGRAIHLYACNWTTLQHSELLEVLATLLRAAYSKVQRFGVVFPCRRNDPRHNATTLTQCDLDSRSTDLLYSTSLISEMNSHGDRFGTMIFVKSRGAMQVVPQGCSAAEGCLICLEGFSEGSAKQLPCSHMFCKKCIGVWYSLTLYPGYHATCLREKPFHTPDRSPGVSCST